MHATVRHIAEVEPLRGIPHRPLDQAKSCRDPFHGDTSIDVTSYWQQAGRDANALTGSLLFLMKSESNRGDLGTIRAGRCDDISRHAQSGAAQRGRTRDWA